MKRTPFLLLIVAAFFIQTNEADASNIHYFDNNTALITIDITFTDAFGEFAVPAFADHTVTHGDRVDVVGFSITDQDGERIKANKVTAAILSSQPLVDTRYQLARGASAEFRLVAVVQLPDTQPQNIQAQVTRLPYWINGKRTTVQEKHLQ